MIFEETPVAGVYTIELEKRGDDRGFFARVFCEREFAELNLTTSFVQVNNSTSADRGTLRGMHYQLAPHAETKIVRCIRGALWDCVIDLRPESPSFGKWFGTELSAENRTMMYVPKGCAHGFVTLQEDTESVLLCRRLLCAGGRARNSLERSQVWCQMADSTGGTVRQRSIAPRL